MRFSGVCIPRASAGLACNPARLKVRVAHQHAAGICSEAGAPSSFGPKAAVAFGVWKLMFSAAEAHVQLCRLH
eukprot:12434808-Alexandrium_andersonii.AAC.1